MYRDSYLHGIKSQPLMRGQMPQKEVHNTFVNCKGDYALEEEVYLFIQMLFSRGITTSVIYNIL